MINVEDNVSMAENVEIEHMFIFKGIRYNIEIRVNIKSVDIVIHQ